MWLVPTLPRRTATNDTTITQDSHNNQVSLPETDGAKVLPTSDQVGFYLASTHRMAPQSTYPIKRACYSFIDPGRIKGWLA